MKKKRVDVNVGDKIKIVSCYYQIPEWSEGSPCVTLSPVLRYDESSDLTNLIEDFLIDLTIHGYAVNHDIEYIKESIKWSGKSLQSLKKHVNKAIKTNHAPYKRTYSEVRITEVEFIEHEDDKGDLYWEIISETIIN